MKNKQYKFAKLISVISILLFSLLMIYAQEKGEKIETERFNNYNTNYTTNWKNHKTNLKKVNYDKAIIRTGTEKVYDNIYKYNYNISSYEWNDTYINEIIKTYKEVIPNDVKFQLMVQRYNIYLINDCVNKELVDEDTSADVCVMAQVDFETHNIYLSGGYDIDDIKINFLHEIGHYVNEETNGVAVDKFSVYYKKYLRDTYNDSYNRLNNDYIIGDVDECWSQLYAYVMLDQKARLNELPCENSIIKLVNEQNELISKIRGWKAYDIYYPTKIYKPI